MPTSTRPRLSHRWLKVLSVTSLVVTGAVTALAGPASASPGVPSQLVMSTQPSSSAVNGEVLATQPAVKVEDSSGAFLSSDTSTSVTVALLNPPSGATLGGTLTVTDSAGVATFAGLSVTGPIGTYYLSFTATSSSTALTGTTSNAITLSASAATQLAVTTQPSAGEILGQLLGQQPVITAEDSSGNAASPGVGGTMTASVTGTGCSISAGSPSTATMTGNVATFSGLELSGTSGDSCTLSFTLSSATNATGISVTTVQASAAVLLSTSPTKIVLKPGVTLPSSVASGAVFGTKPDFLIEDVSGTQVTALNSGTVTASFTAGTPTGGSLTSPTATIVNGEAVFSGFAINAPISTTGYSISFSSSTYTPAAATFAVTLGAAYKLAVVTQPSLSVQSGVAFVTQPKVAIVDSGGNVETTDSTTVVTASVTTGTLTNNTATAVNGFATFNGLTINALVGSGYYLTFSATNLQSVNSSFFSVLAGAASKLVITTQPPSGVATGVALSPAPVVKVEDSGGNVVVSPVYGVTASLVGSTTGALSNYVVSTVNGVATFSNLVITAPIGASYQLRFSSGTLAYATSNQLSVTSGAPAKLVITTAPYAVAQSGVPLAVQPVVSVQDAYGHVVAGAVSTVTARLTTGGVSVSSPSVNTVNGVATFSGLTINALAGTYTLTFTDGSLASAVSGSIVVTVGPAKQLVVTQHPSSFSPIGAPLPVQPVIKVEDSGGNVITTLSTGAVVATIGSGTGGVISAGASANIVAGTATFAGLTLSGTPGVSYLLRFSGAGFSVLDTQHVSVGQLQSSLVIKTTKAWMGRTLTLKTKGGDGTGAVSYAVSSQGTTKCSVTGDVLSYKKKGTCVVVATKAASGNYASVTSAPASIVVAIRPKPRPLNLGFKLGVVSLAGHQTRALTRLANKLSRRSLVKIVVYEPFNRQLAQARGVVIRKFLLAHVPAHARIVVVINTRLHRARLITLRQ